MEINFEQLNTLISVWVGVGIISIIFIFAIGLVVVCYFLSKISDDDNRRFENKVNNLIDRHGKSNKQDKIY